MPEISEINELKALVLSTKVHVERHHIDEGECHSSCNCPVANAIYDALSAKIAGDLKVFVGSRQTDIYLNDTCLSWNLPHPAPVRSFIRMFDWEYGVEPFSFTLGKEE